MTDKQIIDMTIIRDGEKEYKSDDIFRSTELNSFLNRCRLQFTNSLLKEIHEEKGKIIVTTDKDFSKITLDLEDVSDELQRQFFQLYRNDSI